MSETRKLAAILVADLVGYSRLASADEDARSPQGPPQRPHRPGIAARHGRVVKRTGDGAVVEFRSGIDALRCAIESASAFISATSSRRPTAI
jgi:adenylate cyclase